MYIFLSDAWVPANAGTHAEPWYLLQCDKYRVAAGEDGGLAENSESQSLQDTMEMLDLG